MTNCARLFAVLLSLMLAGCARNPSALLNAAGPHAEITGGLFRYFFLVNGIIFVLVIGFLIFALWRRRERDIVAPLQPTAEGERRRTTIVGIAIALSVLFLTSYVCLSYAADRRLIKLDENPELTIEVTGHQWWWEITYPGVTPSDTFTTANEIHVPVNTKVRLVLRSDDVIHSLWVPNLAGKRDIIPGRDQDLVFRADRPGEWQGRCAEFCGLQHAFMRLIVIAEPKDRFAAWQSAQRLPSVKPVSAQERRGRDDFTKGACAMCHVIRGTDAGGYSTNAPELTHLQSRRTIGAGAAPNTPGYLAGWVIDPHGIKPGVHMPTIPLEPADLQALIAYLETLK
jgi:cytochrome c oxidase subunit 2